jgi:TrmH family RNA methyltransferase
MEQGRMHKMKVTQAITSRSNPMVKELLDLKDSREYLFVEGYRIIDEILKSNLPPFEVVFTPESESNPVTIKAKSMASNFTAFSSQVFEKLSETEAPQGLAAFFKKPSYRMEDLIESSGKKAIFLLIHEIQDPGNLGTIFRTARAAGVAGIILSKKSVSISNTKVLRSSMGCAFTVPFVENIDLDTAISYLKGGGITIISADVNTGANIFESEYKLPTCFVLGSEAHGLPIDIIKKSDLSLRLPILNQIESLNLSVSAAVLMYDAVRRFNLY